MDGRGAGLERGRAAVRPPLPVGRGSRVGRRLDTRVERGERSSRSRAWAVDWLMVTPRSAMASTSWAGVSVSASARSSRMAEATMNGA